MKKCRKGNNNNKKMLSTKMTTLLHSSTLQRFPRPTTASNDGSSSSRNGFLSHQIRAVSSPSLSDAVLQGSINGTATAATTTAPLSATTTTSTIKGTTTQLKVDTTTVSAIPNSQSVGVLQKFKRTITNFSKAPTQAQSQTQLQSQPQQQQQPPHSISTGNFGDAVVVLEEGILPSGGGGTAQFYTDTSNETGDNVSGKYRFGPLIWRSSKERRKTKHDRRGKCNSGDSGIQVELENDEQFARVLGNGTTATSATIKVTGESGAQSLMELEHTLKVCGVRRVNSAKVCTSTAAAANAKAKILRRIEVNNEREAPESLPTRSLSQPNGLDTFGIGRADADESDSDSVASHDDVPSSYYPIYAEVLYSFAAAGPQELGLERGALIEVLRKEVGPWWFGRIKKEEASLVEEILDPELGWFPKEFVRVIHCPETDAFFLKHISAQMPQQTPAAMTATVATTTTTTTPSTLEQQTSAGGDSMSDAEATMDENNVTTIIIESSSNGSGELTGSATPLVPSRSLNVMLDSADLLRRSAVKELLDTEVNYVKLLSSICEGYLPAMNKRIDIFSPHSIRLIFSNISSIYKFQRKFLAALRKGIEQNQIAKVFLSMHKEFLCYSNYCNGYPRALIELESYDRIKEAKIILDNCRESENLAELPLSAHLLAPVQRICRYPLHLSEIMKAVTKSAETTTTTTTTETSTLSDSVDGANAETPDTKESITMALEAMKGITEAVNEGKRHSETIARHQASFQNFKGPPLYLHSTRFFLQIDATRQKQNLWNSSYTLFLFDNQLVYCKRDIIKRSHFIYKGRIFLDRCRVVNVRDGKMFGHTIKNSLRIYCEARDKWYDFSFRSANRKHRFLATLALERQFGGKALYVSEMTGYEYAFEERDYSDQSDYDMPESESGGGGSSVGNSLAPLRFRECIYEVGTGIAISNSHTSTSGGDSSSVPDSPAKGATTTSTNTQPKYSDTLPKKSQSQSQSQSRDANSLGSGSGSGLGVNDCQTSSLGRRRLGNWFRKPKSTNSTPNHSPTHKPVTCLSTGDLQQLPNNTKNTETTTTTTTDDIKDNGILMTSCV